MPEINDELQILRPKVQNEINEALKELRKENMAAFLLRTSIMTTHVDNHMLKNCLTGDIGTTTECIKKVNNVRIEALNKLGEMLVEKCGGKMIYLKEE